MVEVSSKAQVRKIEAVDERSRVEYPCIAPSGNVRGADDEQLDALEPSGLVHGGDTLDLSEVVGGGHERAKISTLPFEMSLKVHLKCERVCGDLVVASRAGATPWLSGVYNAVLCINVSPSRSPDEE